MIKRHSENVYPILNRMFSYRNMIEINNSDFNKSLLFGWPTGRGVLMGSGGARKSRVMSFDSAHHAQLMGQGAIL
jgi:hypothetical protein